MHGALGLLFSALIGADRVPAPPPSPLALPAACAAAEPAGREAWNLSLPEAVGIGLDNCETVRVISMSGPFQILCVCEGQPPALRDVPLHAGPGTRPLIVGRLNYDVNPWRFRSEVMAHVRSVEQLYWSLVQHRAQLAASAKAVAEAEELLKREQSELEVSRGQVADLAEGEQRLERFRLDRGNKTADVANVERLLRNILGLPATDGREIVPVTALVEDRREPDWADCLAAMQERQPDILLQREAVRADEERTLLAIARELVAGAFGTPSARLEAAEETRHALDSVRRQREFLTQVVHQTTHSLARFFLEIDANFQQFQTATTLRTAAAKRLEAQRAYYEEGRITLDRYLDAVSQQASAVAQEAQFQTSYNIALVALEEARGTLLSARDIIVAEGPRPRRYHQARIVPQRAIDMETRGVAR